ncbi:AAA family ATPase [Dactylosporangium sp. NPDC050688]|uniref:AAA family ATPase n=1 Tax=Dactylosporangium sp. NPDC050688 TaxID=3157217 RepID=UPI0033E21DD6
MALVRLSGKLARTPTDLSRTPVATSFQGPPGTGKSHSAREYVGGPEGVLVLAPTQRQAANWRSMGWQAQTAHSFLTFPATTSDGRLWFPPKGVSYAGHHTVIHDEIGMYGKDLVDAHAAAAQASFARQIYTGDPYQLPPVGEGLSGMFNLPAAVHRLTAQHRFPVGSRIHDVVYTALEALETGQDTAEGITFRGVDRLNVESMQAAGAVLMFKHETRVRMNEGLRLRLGLPQARPVPGDAVRILARDDTLGLLRNELVNVLEVCGNPQPREGSDDILTAVVGTVDGREIELPMLMTGFRWYRDDPPEWLVPHGIEPDKGRWNEFKSYEIAAQALARPGVAVAAGFGKFGTVWSSQGLEWDHVVLVADWADELWLPQDLRNRHWYVGASRARSRLEILPYVEPVTFQRARNRGGRPLGGGEHLARLLDVARMRAAGGVATFRRGELAKLLGVRATNLPNIVKPGIRAGLLGAGSNSTKIVLA